MVSVLLILAVPVLLYLLYSWLKLPAFPSHKIKEFVNISRQGPISHRAGRPENTLAGIRSSKEEGASGVEVDLIFTKDSVPVLLHDATVDRTSNGSGKVSELTFKEVRELDFGFKFGTEYAGEQIPTLEEALSLCDELHMQIFVEVKRDYDRSVKAITDCLKKHPSLYQLVAVISFFPTALYKLRQADPNVACGLTVMEHVLPRHPDGKLEGKAAWKLALSPYCDIAIRWSVRTWLLDFLGVRLLVLQKDMLLSGLVESPAYWGNRGVSVVTWTVNKKEDKRIMEEEMKIAFLTDCLDPNSSAPEQFQ